MNYEQVLQKLEKNEITPELAYKKIYNKKRPKPGKRATFIKLRIHVPEEGKGINTFLKILFAIPIPMLFARLGLRFADRFAKFEEQGLDVNEISRLLKYSKHTSVQVDTDDAKIDIKIL